MDVPAVDCVAFTNARDSVIDTIQAVGRALRAGGQPGKIATIVVPLLLAPGQHPEQALAASAWAPVWQVIRALREHDERLDAHLTRLRRDRGANPGGRLDLPDWLHVRGVAVPDGFAHAITVRTVGAATASWEEFYGAAQAYRAEHGHLDVPRVWTTPAGLALGNWISSQRTLRRQQLLCGERVRLLDQIGMIWNAHDAKWEHGYTHARAYHSPGRRRLAWAWRAGQVEYRRRERRQSPTPSM